MQSAYENFDDQNRIKYIKAITEVAWADTTEDDVFITNIIVVAGAYSMRRQSVIVDKIDIHTTIMTSQGATIAINLDEIRLNNIMNKYGLPAVELVGRLNISDAGLQEPSVVRVNQKNIGRKTNLSVLLLTASLILLGVLIFTLYHCAYIVRRRPAEDYHTWHTQTSYANTNIHTGYDEHLRSAEYLPADMHRLHPYS